MKLNSFVIQLIFLFLLFSCSHNQGSKGISIASATAGLMKNQNVPFPVYLTEKLEDRTLLEKNFGRDLFIIHTGHILKSNYSKAENEKTLQDLNHLGMNLVNLTLEDFVIAESQEINFENYKQTFLNSSVIDLNQDNLAAGKNIVSYNIHHGIAFIGLSDKDLDKKLSNDKYLVSDYILSILKVKKMALKTATPTTINSFVLIHTLGTEINSVMERLPPSFINSLAN